jgi:endoglucanase
MHWLTIAILSLLASIVPAAAQSDPVRIEGKNFIATDAAGKSRALAIKGINLGNWLTPEGYMFKFKETRAPRHIYEAFERLLGRDGARAFWAEFRSRYVTREDIDFIARAGFNTVRIPLHYGLFMTGDGEMTGEGWALLDRALAWIRDAHLYAIVDLHAAPGGQTGINHDDGSGYPLMFYVPRHGDLTVRLWQEIARRYAGRPEILGFDLLNEPIAPYHDVSLLNGRLEPFYKRLTLAIRAVDPGRIVFLNGSEWSANFEVFGPPFAPNLAYTYHSFWGSTKRDTIQRYINFSNRYNVPLFLGETGELTDDWNEGFRTLHETHGIGWAFWTYKNLDSTSTVVSINRPDSWSDIVAYADKRTPVKPPEATIARAMRQYLDGMRLADATVRWSYLASLGLKSAP